MQYKNNAVLFVLSVNFNRISTVTRGHSVLRIISTNTCKHQPATESEKCIDTSIVEIIQGLILHKYKYEQRLCKYLLKHISSRYMYIYIISSRQTSHRHSYRCVNKHQKNHSSLSYFGFASVMFLQNFSHFPPHIQQRALFTPHRQKKVYTCD